MGLFGGSKSGITDNDRYTVMNLVTDEDYSLYEVGAKFDDINKARQVVVELLKKKMVDVNVYRADRRREKLDAASAEQALGKRSSWAQPEEGKDKFVLLATDHGWRWHQKHWKPS